MQLFYRCGLGLSYAIMLSSSIYAYAATIDPLGVQGVYTCDGYDAVDGAYPQNPSPKVQLNYIATHSIPAQGLAAYDFKLNEPDGTVYSGMAAFNNNSLAIYFSNTKDASDNGIGAANLVREYTGLDKQGKPRYVTKFVKYYFEPKYQHNGSHGSEVCIKDS